MWLVALKHLSVFFCFVSDLRHSSLDSGIRSSTNIWQNSQILSISPFSFPLACSFSALIGRLYFCIFLFASFCTIYYIRQIQVFSSSYPIQIYSREISCSGILPWWTLDSTSDSPFGPTKSANVLPDYTDCTRATPGNPTRFFLYDQERLNYFDGRLRQLIQSSWQFRYGQNSVGTP